MDDQGFDFRQPSERRQPKPFEPPPWEQDAFVQLERRRAEEQTQAGDEADRGASAADEAPTVAAASPAAAGVTGGATPAPEAPPAPEAKGGGVDESVMVEMMAGLAAEEPPAERSYAQVAYAAALVLLGIGAMLIIWGVAALVGSARTGWIGQMSGAGLGAFGAFFFGMGVWLMYRTLKRRGVL